MSLHKEFIGTGEVKGFKFTQIRATNYGFIYLIDTGDTKYYEVFKKVLNRRFGNISYPKQKAFGRWAWTCGTLERAIDKLNSLEEAENNKGFENK